MENEILQVHDLTKVFDRKTVVDRISFRLDKGTVLGIVGESGSGKSTTARIIAGLEKPTSGQVVSRADSLQMVFQSPGGSFDPRRTLGDGITERIRNLGVNRKEAYERAAQMLIQCGLTPDFTGRYPGEVSGGQCQRAAIARALMTRPQLLILDEPTSALDATVQKQILELLKGLQERFSMSYLFITHDIAVAMYMSDFILVMKDGKIVERGEPGEILRSPKHEYTKVLLESVL